MTEESSNFQATHVPKFDGDYDHWSMVMKNLIKSKECWSVVESGYPEIHPGEQATATQRKNYDENKLKDLKVLNYLFQSIDKSLRWNKNTPMVGEEVEEDQVMVEEEAEEEVVDHLIKAPLSATNTITKVYYTPELTSNLICVGQLQEKGVTFIFKDGIGKMYHPMKGLLMSSKMTKNRLFPIFADQEEPYRCMQLITGKELWHRRFAHTNHKALRTMQFNSMQTATQENEKSSHEDENEEEQASVATPTRQRSNMNKKQPTWMKDYQTNFAEEDVMAILNKGRVFRLLTWAKSKAEKHIPTLHTLKEGARAMIYKDTENVDNPFKILSLVDDLQKLGVAYHFEDEIRKILKNIIDNYYKSPEKWTKMDLNLKSLGFRLLRQHGYNAPQEIYEDIKDDLGNFKGQLHKEIIGMLNLYEASYHSLEDEQMLDNACDFTTKYLKQSLENIDNQHLSSHWIFRFIEWFHDWRQSAYEKRNSMNPTLLELAKLDFNIYGPSDSPRRFKINYVLIMIAINRWWNETTWDAKLTSLRDRYCYDVYGTLDELEPFTEAIARNRIVACDKVLISKPATMATSVRRSGNYPPSLWSYDHIQSLNSKYTGEKHMPRLHTLKEAVRAMIYKDNENVDNPFKILGLVDDLQRLGVAYHFEDEIRKVLKNIFDNYYKSPENWTKMDLNLKSLGFRVLRQHGYHVPQEIFEDIKDNSGNFKGELQKDIIGMLNLYEASYHSLEDEHLLDDARDFTTKYLKQSLENIADQHLSSLNRWWNKTTWDAKLTSLRDRLVECFMWAVAANSLPPFSPLRRTLAQVIAMTTTIDDIYDVYGTLDELEQFTEAISRWDINSIEELPEYMKICFVGFYNSVNEIAYYTLTDTGTFNLPYLRKAVIIRLP
ncbi:LOW QUALITY PROTEIN: hypothetical protein M8C21_001843 [Ambrosia artemisiifolia]|uniref:Uncharacterized protein n=1 Tax=Ambrosia artemisiifolia TaxID=4212 RepID=A0AAD5GJW1_AMBAR|nr:LOW QUALITY PROTEIN: hypothetical protein M8C21_001843 [Ambrosia artemisiifolia]